MSGSFFRSRWVERPEHVAELEPTLLPGRFRAAGVAAGLKPEGLDVGVLVSDEPDTVSAARFTTNARVGAPVAVSRQARLGGLRAVAANAAHSNVGDGRRGLETALAQQAATADAIGIAPDQVVVASTGVIGTELPREPVLGGIRAACAELGSDARTFSESIITSDRWPKRACLEVRLPSGTVRLSAQAKGAGMISPRYATTFCFVQTDARLAPETVELLTGVCVKRSFDRISVDGQLSTSDTVVVAGGRGLRGGGGARDPGRDRLRRGPRRAAAPAGDRDRERRGGRRADRPRGRPRPARPGGDGGTRGGQLAARQDGAQRRGPELRAGAPGRRPGLATGRGLRGGSGDRGPAGGVRRRRARSRGRGVARLEAAFAAPEVELALTLPGEGGETEVFFSDLSEGYVRLNATYTS